MSPIIVELVRSCSAVRVDATRRAILETIEISGNRNGERQFLACSDTDRVPYAMND